MRRTGLALILSLLGLPAGAATMQATWLGTDRDSGLAASMQYVYDLDRPGVIRETDPWLDIAYGGDPYAGKSPVRSATLSIGDDFSYTLHNPKFGYLMSGSGDDFDHELFMAAQSPKKGAVLNAFVWLQDWVGSMPDFSQSFTKIAIDGNDLYLTPGMTDYGWINYHSVEVSEIGHVAAAVPLPLPLLMLAASIGTLITTRRLRP